MHHSDTVHQMLATMNIVNVAVSLTYGGIHTAAVILSG